MGAAAIPMAMMVAGGYVKANMEESGADSKAAYYDYLGGMSNANAELAEARAVGESKQIGEQAFSQNRDISRKISQTVGAQRAALAGGAGASSRTAQDIVGDTIDKGQLDEMAINYNATQAQRNAKLSGDAAALNYRSQATGYRLAGDNTRTAAKINRNASLLETATSVASKWYQGNKVRPRSGEDYSNMGEID